MQGNGHPGRPRDPHLDEAILAAAREVFLERGYRESSLAEIARRAGVATPAIYRRWPSKAQIALAIVIAEQQDRIPDTGDLVADLEHFVRQRIRTWTSPFYRRVVLGLLADAQADAGLAAVVTEGYRTVRQAAELRIGAAIERGELATDLDPERFIDLLIGPLLMGVTFLRDGPAEEEAPLMVERALRGAAREATARTSSRP